MIVNVSTTQRNASVVDVQACLYGVQSEVTKAVDPDDIRIELMGDPVKIAHVIGRTRSKIISVLDKAPRQD